VSISLKELCFSYNNAYNHENFDLINIPSWSLSQNERAFLHGPSGCGKSTLLNLICGILLPSSGEITVLNERIDKLSQSKRNRFRANHIGYVFQQFNLIPYLNAIDNIKLAAAFSKAKHKENSEQRAKNLLEQLQISNSDWNKPSSQLSIGQQQRVAIARALVNKPELLIADEPSSSLDADNRDNFMNVLMSTVSENNISLLFVSHDIALSQHFERTDALPEINTPRGLTSCS